MLVHESAFLAMGRMSYLRIWTSFQRTGYAFSVYGWYGKVVDTW